MRNRMSIDVLAVLSALAAAATILASSCEFAPRSDGKLHAALGTALAQEAVSLLGPDGQITVMTRDTEAFPQPAIDLLRRSFTREVRRAGALIAATQFIQVDPLRPVAVPPGDFYEVLRRSPASHVIVSFLGPPTLSRPQRASLGRPTAKIVAFCPGTLVEAEALAELFEAGMLHSAVVSRRAVATRADPPTTPPRTFDQLYAVIKADPLTK